MQNLEDANNASAIEAAGGPEAAPKSAPEAPMSALNVSPVPPPPSPALNPDPSASSAVAPAPFPPPVPEAAPTASVASLPPAPEVPQHIAIEEFAKVELRVAQILVAERIPKADKLLRLEVDLGYEKRQILAGIAQYYEPEKLIGRKIVIVANLAPRKMRGLESNGMLLAASLPDGAPVLAGFLEEVPLGARLK
jgi:methionyl-tRNA synthetase